MNNWLWVKSGDEWTISPFSSNLSGVWYVISEEWVDSGDSSKTDYGVHPVLYLSSNISLEGEGTESNPYTIVS